MKLILPVKERGFKISQKYGENSTDLNGPDGHNAVDIAAGYGTWIYASHDGTVVRNQVIPLQDKWKPRFKKDHTVIVIRSHDKTYETEYWHNQKNFPNVGDVVKQGDIIGKMGATGLAYGPHVHWGLRLLNSDGTIKNYKPHMWGRIDPLQYVTDNTMRYVINANTNDQYLVDDTLKIALSIANIEELNRLKDRGLSDNPERVEDLDGYLIYHGGSTEGVKDFFNL